MKRRIVTIYEESEDERCACVEHLRNVSFFNLVKHLWRFWKNYGTDNNAYNKIDFAILGDYK